MIRNRSTQYFLQAESRKDCGKGKKFKAIGHGLQGPQVTRELERDVFNSAKQKKGQFSISQWKAFCVS